MEKKMRMQLFGKFYLENGKTRLDEDSLHSNKLTKLLAYIMINRNRMLLRGELIDVFWEDGSKNPESALKNLMYRLRTSLKAFGEEEYICTYPGAYRWNPEIEVETDYEEFETLALKVKVAQDDQERKNLCQRAIAGYNGNISEKLGSETWILSKTTYYRSLYMDVVKELGQIYEGEGAWSMLENLCNEALPVDSLDEDLHYWIIRSLWEQKKYDLAMRHYENISRQLYDSLGIRTTEKLQSIFKEMQENADGHIVNMDNLMNEVEEDGKPSGVFICDYQNFRQIYRVEARRIRRLGIAEYVLLLTLRRSGGVKRAMGADSSLMEGMTELCEVLRNSLRIGDVVARYSLTQYIVLLPSCSYESGVMVAERIITAFKKRIGKKRLEIVYELEEVALRE